METSSALEEGGASACKAFAVVAAAQAALHLGLRSGMLFTQGERPATSLVQRRWLCRVALPGGSP